MKVEYASGPKGELFTKCPYGNTFIFYDRHRPVRVGSYRCQKCVYFVFHDREKEFIECARSETFFGQK